MMTIVWLAAMILFMAVEVATVGLTSVWFAIGALAALILSAFQAALWLQIAIFIVVSALMLILTRPLARKFLNSRRKATNADRVLSMVGVVTEDIDNLAASGTVFVGGKDWTARSFTGEPIQKGVNVRPMSIDGVKLIVVPAADVDESEDSSEEKLHTNV